MNSFEINKILGALLGTCLVLVAVHIASGAIFTPEPPAKPGYEIAVKAEGRRAEPRRLRRLKSPIETSWRARRPSAAPKSASNAKHATTSKKAKAPRSAPISMASSGARSHRCRASTTARIEEARRQLDVRCTEQVADQAQCRCSGHGHDVCRHLERETARRRDRLSQHAFGPSNAAADGSGRRCSGRERTGRRSRSGNSSGCPREPASCRSGEPAGRLGAGAALAALFAREALSAFCRTGM